MLTSINNLQLRRRATENGYSTERIIKDSIKYTDYTFSDFIENKIKLDSYNLPDLKKIAKRLKLNITAKKKVIINRIIEHYMKVKSVILIQKIFRGYLVKMSFILRGPALKNRNICVNDKDGFTLEPLNEIPFERFYSFCDKKGFVYGFDIILLYISYKKNNKMINPFSREKFPIDKTNNILRLENKIKILFPYIYDKNEIYEIQKYEILPSQSARRTHGLRINTNINLPSHATVHTEESLHSTSNLSHRTIQTGESINHIRFIDNEFNFTDSDEWTLLPIQRREPQNITPSQTNSLISTIFVSSEQNINEPQNLPTNIENNYRNILLQDTSYNEVPSFINNTSSHTNQIREPINLTQNNTDFTLQRLGDSSQYYSSRHVESSQNYTITNQKFLLVKKMQEIRSYPIQTRIENLFIEIDLLGNYTSSSWFNEIMDYSVFFMSLYTIWNYRIIININEKKKISQLYDPFMTHTIYNTRNMLNNDIKEICVTVMENLVYGGIDEEYRKLGVYRILMALTLVNTDARNTYNWLYESIL